MRGINLQFRNQNEYYETLGYLAAPRRIVSIDAEIPSHMVGEFRSRFGNNYFEIVDTCLSPSGLPSKLGKQYRINLANINNIVPALTQHLGRGSRSCVKRINRSNFVEQIILNNGFRFGKFQNLESIKTTIPQQYLADFMRGLNR
ncbi:MAG: hypothetical protein FWF51_04970 [Chitinivibrionia bacterium]|nr:hypothetical protein [Chitinivibrionia bacterium]